MSRLTADMWERECWMRLSPGAVFTSPTPDQIFEGIKAVATDKGVLMVIKNYTGDVMNFEMAGEMAQMEGIKVARLL